MKILRSVLYGRATLTLSSGVEADIIYSRSPYTHLSICLVFAGRNVPLGFHIKLADHSLVGSLSCPH